MLVERSVECGFRSIGVVVDDETDLDSVKGVDQQAASIDESAPLTMGLVLLLAGVTVVFSRLLRRRPRS
jgi:hypothetical protein